LLKFYILLNYMPQRPMFPHNPNAKLQDYLIALNTTISQLQQSNTLQTAQVNGIQRGLAATSKATSKISMYLFNMPVY
jgi:hypothetical protein